MAKPTHSLQARAYAVSAMLACVAMGSANSHAAAQNTDEEDLASAYSDLPIVSIATGSRQLLSRAPAVATVITAADIQAMGATDLDEVMESIAGVHVARSTQAYQPMYVIRGINLGFNPQVLMLVNGVPISSIFAGNRGFVWGGFPLENVARIEVIRGPGSALYGADALAGVINVITKSPEESSGTTVGARAGSFNAYDAWVLNGGKWGPISVAAYVRRGATDGAKSIVQADAQTGWDALRGTNASHAPGPINNGRDFMDGSLDLSLDKWRWRFGIRDRNNVGSSVGIASALDPTGYNRSQMLTSDLNYNDDNVAPHWALNAQISAMHYSERSDLVLYPPGAVFGGSPYADGMIGTPHKWERHERINAAATYSGLSNHRMRVGIGAQWSELYKIRQTRNSNNNFTPIGSGSIADIEDVSQTRPFLRPHARQLRYIYGQDEWNLAQDWTLTSGLRHDDYSDFGGTTNPRLALVWDTAYNITTKLMAGTAFRAPSFTELYAVNNPVVTGNAALKPEKSHTIDAAVSWQASPQWQVSANIFHYKIDNIIQLVSGVYQNKGKQSGNGLELESNWTVNNTLRLSGNYSFQYSLDGASEHDAGNAPHHQLYARADWRMLPKWSAHAQINWISNQTRVYNDTRPSLSSYNTVDLTVRSAPESKGWQTAISVRNLFDADVREPSAYDYSAGHPFISLPYDMPMPGRSLYIQGTYMF